MYKLSTKKKEWAIHQIKILVDSGMSKAEIARKLGILPQQLNNIINGSRGVSDSFLDKLIKTFNINQADLYSQLLPDPNADSIYKRIIQIFTEENISVNDFKKYISKERGTVFENALHWDNEETAIQWVDLVLKYYPKYSRDWVIYGQGEMVPHSSVKHKIPVYADVASIGGHNEIVADTTQKGNVLEWIDAGDWFPGATAAIHHYGDSMLEYPSGCILAIKRVEDMRLIINGKNYVIETDEFRITKQLQYDGGDFLIAYSTNRETYPDGRLIHAPMKIPMSAIRHIDLVLGSVVKEFSNGAVPIINNQ